MHRYIIRSLPLLLLLSMLWACKKDNYLHDGGTATTVSSLSNYDYLKSHKYHYFDTLVLVIDHFNLKDSVNKAGTFFAPTDFSITTLMRAMEDTSLAQFCDSVSSRLITQFLFKDSITLNNVTLAAKTFPNWADTLSGINKIQGTYNTQNVLFSYYQLQYIRINGSLDGSSGVPPGDLPDAILLCQTTGIKTSSGGTTLHILANNAVLPRR